MYYEQLTVFTESNTYVNIIEAAKLVYSYFFSFMILKILHVDAFYFTFPSWRFSIIS